MITLDHKSSLRARRSARASSYALLACVGLLGVLAFICSVVSPEDDDIQQEFVQATKAGRPLVRDVKSIPTIEIQGKSRVAPVAVLRIPFSVRRFSVELVVVPGFQSRKEIFSRSITGRSPPSQAFS